MAQALSFRNMAKNFQRQSDAWGRLAKRQDQASKDLPQSNTASDAELKAAIDAADLATRSFFIAQSLENQAAQYNALADDAGEPA